MKKLITALFTPFAFGTAILLAAAIAVAEPKISTLRGSANLDAEEQAPRMGKIENHDQKRQRAYPQQPPTIPHDITGYQVDKNFNKCLDCHARTKADESQAPMVSITHFMNSEGQFLADVTPARYFCNQCHVPQMDVKPMVENQFVDMDNLINTDK